MIDFDRLERELPELRERYRAASPFPHIVLDDVVRPEVIDDVYREFAAVPEDGWRKYVHVNERKEAHTDPSAWGPVLQDLLAALASDRFVAILEELSGHAGLQADLDLDGGGLHRSLPGGFLNVHADFTAHHVHQDWRRRVNMILYLNPDWEPEWGGGLELWSTDMTTCEATLVPEGNRMLLFSTSEDSYHGHPDPLACPPDRARQSLALYYFSQEPDPLIRSTDYRARPGAGPVKRSLIWADKQVVHAYDVAKRRLRLSDDTTGRLLGHLDRFRPSRRRGSAPDG